MMMGAPAWANLETLVGAVSTDGSGHVSVHVRLLNAGTTPVRVEPAARLEASLTVGGKTIPIVLSLSDPSAPTTLAAGAFVAMQLDASLPDDRPVEGIAVLSLPTGSSFAFQFPAGGQQSAAHAAVPAPRTVVEQSMSSPRADTGNAFLHNLSAYDPIYAVYGPGTDSAAKIQISFKYQLFGRDDGPASERSWLGGLHFAYTQRLYWDIGKKSSPFRNVDYMPELVYIVPARPLGSSSVFGGQVGLRHESNGRDGVDSRSLNTLYVQPVTTLPIGRYRLSVRPRVWAFLGDLSDNPDVKRYRGNTGIFAEIGSDDGLRLTTNSRLNFGSGKGSIDATVSYPLNRWIPGLNLYAFGQGFTGYGENLLDYNRHQTRLRLGVGIVR